MLWAEATGLGRTSVKTQFIVQKRIFFFVTRDGFKFLKMHRKYKKNYSYVMLTIVILISPFCDISINYVFSEHMRFSQHLYSEHRQWIFILTADSLQNNVYQN